MTRRRVPNIVAVLKEGANVAVGDRRHRESRILGQASPSRALASRVLSVITSAAAVPGFRDTQCGFKAFTADAAGEIFSRLRTDGFAFDIEVLLLARRLDLHVVQVPVTYRHDTASTLRLGPDGLRMLADIVRICARLKRPGGGSVVATPGVHGLRKPRSRESRLRIAGSGRAAGS